MSLLLPGDSLSVEQFADKQILTGPGLASQLSKDSVKPVTGGFLRTKERQNKVLVYLESPASRYIPGANDFVIGTVVSSGGESFRVKLSPFSPNATLSAYSMPNATRKNRLNFRKGALVYARVGFCDPDLEIELECIDATTGKSDGFGQLDGGYVFDIDVNYSRYLFNALKNAAETHTVISALTDRCKFEIAVGVNGRVWVKIDDGTAEGTSKEKKEDEEEDVDVELRRNTERTTLAVAECIKESKSWKPEEISAKISAVFSKFHVM